VRQTEHEGRIAAVAATSKAAKKVDASRGAVTESWAPEILPTPRAMGGKADVPPGKQQLELAFVVFVRFERTREGLKLVGVRNRQRAMTGRPVE